MLGAPLGGTTRGGQYGVEPLTLSLITPPNGSGGAWYQPQYSGSQVTYIVVNPPK